MLAKLLIIAAILAIEDKSAIYNPSTQPANAPAVRLSDGPHLFIDDDLIAESRGVRRVVNRPSRDVTHRNPIISGKTHGCFQPYMSVLRNRNGRGFRLWFGAHTEDMNPSRSLLAYMESADGVNFSGPRRLLETPVIQFGCSVIEDGGGFKFAWWAPSAAAGELPGMKVASSPDGIVWKQVKPPDATSDVVLKHNHDINSIFRDPLRKRYIAVASTYVTDPAWEGERRVTTQSVSDDLLYWSPPWRILVPDPKVEHEQTQFYAMDGFLRRGRLLIGMVKVLRDDLKADDPPDPPDAYGIGYTALAWTRDGEHWTRDREIFFDRDPRKGSWDHAHAWIDEQVENGDDVMLYYAGYARGHKVNRFEERQIGMVTMKRDRYVARAAGDETGEIVTRPIVIDAEAITINANTAGGEIRVAVCDESGAALEGFGFDDCDPIKSDGVALPVKWRSPVARLRDRTIRLKFKLTRGRVFAFDK